MSQPNPIQTTKYADHLRGCADLAKEIASRLDIRDDSARQACLATIIISADRHNLFLEPLPLNTKTVVKPNGGEPAPVPSTERDEAAARKADEQIKEIVPNPTPEQADGAARAALLDAIDKGRNLLNKEGYTPIMTPKVLNEIIKDELRFQGNLGTLDTEHLELVVKLIAGRLDTFKANKRGLGADEVDF